MPIANGGDVNSQPNNSPGLSSHEPSKSTWTPQQKVKQIDASQPPLREGPAGNSPVPFFHLLERLKTTKREGWRRFGIGHGESIADHMYRMSVITMLAPPTLSYKLDVPRCSKMALIHDMAESLVGDITPMDGVSKEEKNHRESTTMDYICKDLLGGVNGGLQGKDMRAVWQEYEDGVTLESQFVHDVDKLELVLQMVEYEQSHKCRVDLSEFEWVATRITLPEMREWCKEILKEREFLWMTSQKQAPPRHPDLTTKESGPSQ